MKSAAEKLNVKEISLELDRILNQLEELNMISETVNNIILILLSQITIYLTMYDNYNSIFSSLDTRFTSMFRN